MGIFDIFTNESEKVQELKELVSQYKENAELYQEEYEDLKERITELELSLEDQDWQRLSGGDNKNFSRKAISDINRLARIYWLKNPLISRAVKTQANYVFGQGMNIYSENEQIDEVLQDFLNDDKNRVELTEHQAMMQKEFELQLFGNLFFVFFVDENTGRVLTRTIPMDEIEEIITDPEDVKTPLYYKRVRDKKIFDYSTGNYEVKQEVTYYPDWKNTDPEATIAGTKVPDNQFIYHVTTNKLSDQKFGVSEVYSAIDWAKAYKEFMENWASLARSYATFAWKIKARGKQGKAAAKKQLNTTYSSTRNEDNPPPVAGSAFIRGENEDAEPMNLKGANMSAEDGNKMIHMISAGTGVFYHYLTGDPSTGNLASTKSMELPMLFQFQNRQKLWERVFKEIGWFVVKQSVKSNTGKLSQIGEITTDEFDREQVEFDTDEEGNEIEASLTVKFPSILQKDMKETINAIIQGATMGGPQNTAKTMPMRDVTRYVLQALGEENVEQKVNEIYPEQEESRRSYSEAIEELTSKIEKLVENKQL